MKLIKILFAIVLSGLIISCNKDKDKNIIEQKHEPHLIMYFDIDSTMERYDNMGNPVNIAPGNAAQNPAINYIAAHYVEFTSSPYIQIGDGEKVYDSPTTDITGEKALIFDSVFQAKDKEVFLRVPLKSIQPGTYKYLRVSVAYQNYDITYHVDTTINGVHINQDVTGTIANFLGFNNYIDSYTIKEKSITVNGAKKQGYWGFESNINVFGQDYPVLLEGEVPEGATTVPNVLAETSPIPSGSCLITGDFEGKDFVVTGNEKKDIKIKVKVSTNGGFEWKDINGNGKYDPLKGEKPVDMGVRGIKGVVE